MTDKPAIRQQVCAVWVWCAPILLLAVVALLYQGGLQTSTFLFLNRGTAFLPDTLWAWFTFLGNGWGIFAVCFPLLLLAPRMLCSGIVAGIMSAILSSFLKAWFEFPRPAAILNEVDFHRIGEPLLQKAFPSGHTLTAFAVAAALYFACKPASRRSMFWVFIVASLVGLSRIGVGAHWLTDVLGGAAIGLWCGLIGASVARYIPSTQLVPTQIGPRFVACAGALAIYMLLTETMDLTLNLPLQYGAAILIAITLTFFVKAQLKKSI
ncbi:Membrane-associated phospholipid phosphatase [Polynucleobacter meluiroseus]|uniref:Membrane-associated phospholipid phosphatase n=1 Tax=Polynucleobacter meluiroseus TaxID=1938814 RepID=A0A240E3H9_9BURK|nr:phosphatase PAP2 family protein [Polynucleobacter meluiroseus]SNX29430.1 Membrane-associated phospholipid phosphatase [Polynucleobacter meluiroseus]